MIRYEDGDLLAFADQGMFDAIAHGCNCFCCFGAGIARQIAKKYPEAYQADCFTECGNRKKLGTFSKVVVSSKKKPFVVYNAYTQFTVGQGLQVSYQAIKDVFILIRNDLGDTSRTIGLPKIGAGLAGGDWNKIEKIINEVFDGSPHKVVVVNFK